MASILSTIGLILFLISIYLSFKLKGNILILRKFKNKTFKFGCTKDAPAKAIALVAYTLLLTGFQLRGSTTMVYITFIFWAICLYGVMIENTWMMKLDRNES